MDKELSIALYQTISDDNQERVFENWHASSIAECPRSHYFKRLGIKSLTKPSAAMVLRWDAGHAMELVIRKHIDKLFPELKSNERLTSEILNLTGEYDNLTGSTLIEIKTVHDYAFIERDGDTYLKDADGKNARGQNKWKAKQTPYLHHELQNHCYVELLGKQGMKVDEIIYVYISLSGRIVVYRTKVQQALLDNVNKRLAILNKAWEEQKPPECICDQVDHPLYGPVMRYCNYKTETTCCSLELIELKEK